MHTYVCTYIYVLHDSRVYIMYFRTFWITLGNANVQVFPMNIWNFLDTHRNSLASAPRKFPYPLVEIQNGSGRLSRSWQKWYRQKKSNSLDQIYETSTTWQNFCKIRVMALRSLFMLKRSKRIWWISDRDDALDGNEHGEFSSPCNLENSSIMEKFTWMKNSNCLCDDISSYRRKVEKFLVVVKKLTILSFLITKVRSMYFHTFDINTGDSMIIFWARSKAIGTGSYQYFVDNNDRRFFTLLWEPYGETIIFVSPEYTRSYLYKEE